MTTRSSSPAKRTKRWGTVLAATALVALVSMPLTTATGASAVDASLPTWQDVQDAKNNQAATAGKIKEIEALLVQVNKEVENTKKELEAAISASALAEEELLKANNRLDELNLKLAESTEEADSASQEAAALVGLMYRSGGIDRSTEMFLESDADTSDELLERLASMSKATERNSKIAEDATRAKNDAQSLGDQADVVSQERERLREDAEARKNSASTLAAAALEKQQTQEAQRDTLDAQLAALKDTTAKTVDGYEERLAQEAEDRRKEQENNNSGGGSGPGPSPSGWGLPIYSYYVSEEFGGSRDHGGIDLAAGMWTPIYAAAAGTVTRCYEFSNYGNTIDITHPDGSITRYAHQPYGGLAVSCGQWVSQGQRIGAVGTTGWSSGPHLHFETWPNSGYRVNPRGFMADRGVWF